MSSALLKFHEISPERFDAAILAAAIEASPQPVAITENGNVIYENHSFAQLMSATSLKSVEPMSADPGWQTTNFAVAGRKLSLTTARVEGSDLRKSDTQYLAMIGRLVGGVAHDFNNLLTGILLYCDLMQSKAENAGPLWKKTDEIRRAAEHGAALIRQLMTIGREELGEQPSVCFNQVVRDMEGLLRHLLGEQIEIAMELADDLARVGITCASAQQIILNLALNARDAMPTGGVLRFESRWGPPGEKFFEFVVSDTGHGMDDHTASRAFDPFFSTKASGRGTGLATVRSIVEAAEGSIDAESSPRGTRMIMRLPELAHETEKNKATEKNQAIDLPGRSNPKQSDDRGAAQ
jgi:signal transduction histidine kinase